MSISSGSGSFPDRQPERPGQFQGVENALSAREHEDLTQEPEPVDSSKSAEEVGGIALEAWDEFVGVDLSELNKAQLLNSAKRFIGNLSSYAIAHNISPPEAAILLLPEEAEVAAEELLEEALRVSPQAKKPLHQDTAKRLERVLTYIKNQGKLDPTDTDELRTPLGTMTLGQVVRVIDTQDADMDSIKALERVRAEMESRQLN